VPLDLELSTFNNAQHPLRDWRFVMTQAIIGSGEIGTRGPKNSWFHEWAFTSFRRGHGVWCTCDRRWQLAVFEASETATEFEAFEHTGYNLVLGAHSVRTRRHAQVFENAVSQIAESANDIPFCVDDDP
jgi:hypothetical protein